MGGRRTLEMDDGLCPDDANGGRLISSSRRPQHILAWRLEEIGDFDHLCWW